MRVVIATQGSTVEVFRLDEGFRFGPGSMSAQMVLEELTGRLKQIGVEYVVHEVIAPQFEEPGWMAEFRKGPVDA